MPEESFLLKEILSENVYIPNILFFSLEKKFFSPELFSKTFYKNISFRLKLYSGKNYFLFY